MGIDKPWGNQTTGFIINIFIIMHIAMMVGSALNDFTLFNNK